MKKYSSKVKPNKPDPVEKVRKEFKLWWGKDEISNPPKIAVIS